MNKRQHTRVNVLSAVHVKYFRGHECSCKGTIVDLSVGGMGVLIPESIEVDKAVRLTFTLNDKLSFKDFKGVVSRTETLGEQYSTLIGINLQDLEPGIRDLISKYLLDKRLEQYNYRKGV